MELDLAPYAYHDGVSDSGNRYELFGFIVHCGIGVDTERKRFGAGPSKEEPVALKTGIGHYWAYVKDSESETPETPWTCYNDVHGKETSGVTPMTNEDIRKIVSEGEVDSGQIYIVVYKKVGIHDHESSFVPMRSLPVASSVIATPMDDKAKIASFGVITPASCVSAVYRPVKKTGAFKKLLLSLCCCVEKEEDSVEIDL